MHDDVAPVLRAVRTFGMPGTDAGAPVRPAPDGWDQIAYHLRNQRLSGLAVAAATAGVLGLDAAQLAHLAELDLAVQTITVRAEQLTIEVVADLVHAGVPVRVLKGPVTARWGYADPAWRPFIDVDLLVPAEDLDATVARLEQQGAARALPELRPGHDRRFGKSVTLTHPRRVEVDLHRTLAVGPLGQAIPTDELWRAADEVELVPGCVVPTLGRDLAFLHACLHLLTGGPAGPLLARDVAGLWAAADLSRCADMAADWQATAVVQAAVTAAQEAVPLPAELSTWASALRPTTREQRILAAYRSATTPGRLALASLRHIRGLPAKVAYARALALPSAANRSARHRSWLDHAGRVLRLGRRSRS